MLESSDLIRVKKCCKSGLRSELCRRSEESGVKKHLRSGLWMDSSGLRSRFCVCVCVCVCVFPLLWPMARGRGLGCNLVFRMDFFFYDFVGVASGDFLLWFWYGLLDLMWFFVVILLGWQVDFWCLFDLGDFLLWFAACDFAGYEFARGWGRKRGKGREKEK